MKKMLRMPWTPKRNNLKHDLERENLSSWNRSSEKKSKDLDFAESKGTWVLSFTHGTMIVVWKMMNLMKVTHANYEMN